MTTPSATTRTLLSRWDDVRFLLAVLRKGSFTRAAIALQTEQSTVSRRIATLEAELGVTLFERNARAPTPTKTALALREVAERIEAEFGCFVDAAVGELQQTVAGRVKIALTEEMAISFVIPRVLPRLREAYPELHVDLIASYQAADLMGHEADIALRFFKSNRGDLIGKSVGRISMAILCSRKRLRTLQRTALAELEWITVELGGLPSPESDWFHAVIGKAPTLTCSSYLAQFAAIRAGLGVGVGPKLLAKLDPELAVLEQPALPLPQLELYLFTRRAIRQLPRIAAVIDVLTEELQRAASA